MPDTQTNWTSTNSHYSFSVMAHKGKLKTRSEKEKKERKQNITTDINTVNITQNRGANHLSNKMQLQNKQTFSLIVSWKKNSLPRTENNSCHMHLFLHSVQLISSSFFFFWGGGGEEGVGSPQFSQQYKISTMFPHSLATDNRLCLHRCTLWQNTFVLTNLTFVHFIWNGYQWGGDGQTTK